MSEENGKVCCNCRHNLRVWKKDYCHCICEIDGKRMSYIQVMSGWCRHWAKERKERKNEHTNTKCEDAGRML